MDEPEIVSTVAKLVLDDPMIARPAARAGRFRKFVDKDRRELRRPLKIRTNHRILRASRGYLEISVRAAVSVSRCSFEPNNASVVMSEVQDGIQYLAAQEILENIDCSSAGLITLSI